MTDYLKCSKCGSEKFKPDSWNPLAPSWLALEIRGYACADCGHVMKIGKTRPEYQKVILSPDEKVVD